MIFRYSFKILPDRLKLIRLYPCGSLRQSISFVFGARVGHFAATPQSDVVGIWSHDLGVMATLSVRQKMPFLGAFIKSLCCTTQEESCIGIFSVFSLPIFSVTAEILHSKYGFTALQMGTGNLKCMTVGSVSLSLISSELNWSNFTCGSDCHQFLTVTTDMGQLTELPCFNVPAQNSCLEEQLLQFSSTKVLLLAVLLISSELNWSDFTHGSNCQ